MQNNMAKKTKGTTLANRKIKDLFFYITLFALPTLQFLIFYVGVNANSILLAFQRYKLEVGANGYQISASLENFKDGWKLMVEHAYSFKYAFLAFFVSMGISFPLALIFSFYIYKKYAFSGIFKVLLFMPSLISGLVFSLLFNYITTDVYQFIVQKVTQSDESVLGLLYNRDTRLGTIIFFNIWCSFGSNLLLFSGGMSGIDESIVESAQLDGANLLQEFIFITIPMIFPTIKQLIVLAISGIFGNQFALMSLYGQMSSHATELATFGYMMFIWSTKSALVVSNGLSYGILSAIGLLLTIVTLPVTLLVRKALDKWGPRTE